jgi:hypothetical protein
VKEFERWYPPELVGGEVVVITDYEMLAGKLGEGLKQAPAQTRHRLTRRKRT